MFRSQPTVSRTLVADKQNSRTIDWLIGLDDRKKLPDTDLVLTASSNALGNTSDNSNVA